MQNAGTLVACQLPFALAGETKKQTEVPCVCVCLCACGYFVYLCSGVINKAREEVEGDSFVDIVFTYQKQKRKNKRERGREGEGGPTAENAIQGLVRKGARNDKR